MRIVRLSSENYKRLKAVEITPKGHVVVISGKNGAGKSSILESIWVGLGGGDAIPAVPVRKGAEKATITLDLGEYIVTRTFNDKGPEGYTTALKVEGKDGMRASKPQTLLDGLLGRFCLDPMAFIRLTPKQQFDALKHLVPGLDLDEIKAKDEHDYEARTVENRKAKEATAAAASIGAKDGKVERVHIEPIQADIGRASEHNQAINERAARRKAARNEADNLKAKTEKVLDRIKELQAEIERLIKENEIDLAKMLDLNTKLANAEALPDLLDTAELVTRLNAAQAANSEADKQERREKHLAEAKQHETASQALTEAMEARAEHKRTMIAQAKFPVEGLSLGEEEVLVDGLPFAQAATSQKIRTAMAIAMASNPTIRVIRVEDGSLLDSDAFKIIADVAKENDFQVWCEVVNDGTGTGIIIEDGHIKET